MIEAPRLLPPDEECAIESDQFSIASQKGWKPLAHSSVLFLGSPHPRILWGFSEKLLQSPAPDVTLFDWLRFPRVQEYSAFGFIQMIFDEVFSLSMEESAFAANIRNVGFPKEQLVGFFIENRLFEISNFRMQYQLGSLREGIASSGFTRYIYVKNGLFSVPRKEMIVLQYVIFPVFVGTENLELENFRIQRVTDVVEMAIS
ncbi:hypothetical protein NPIL_342321 [Nephila pilipes]|uniref:Uncharacterized protein n=1 Tax=Nephila pilipes TaxID=299642 RepID=A0A8X6R043_NEPPI|nr:hypothetical protein NPIL_342321 [Nephila pilipes]